MLYSLIYRLFYKYAPGRDRFRCGYTEACKPGHIYLPRVSRNTDRFAIEPFALCRNTLLTRGGEQFVDTDNSFADSTCGIIRAVRQQLLHPSQSHASVFQKQRLGAGRLSRVHKSLKRYQLFKRIFTRNAGRLHGKRRRGSTARDFMGTRRRIRRRR